MTINEQFLSSVLPEPVCLLGQWLRPFSVGHEILLQRHENVFRSGVAADEMILRTHLFMGVFICCQTWEENMAATTDHSMPAKILKWQTELGPFSIDEKGMVFAKYLAGGNEFFKFNNVKKKKAGPPLPKPGAPLLAILQTFLHKHLNLSLSDAMNMPLAQAWNLYLVVGEQEQEVRIYSQEDKETDDAVRVAAKAMGLRLITSRRPYVV